MATLKEIHVPDIGDFAEVEVIEVLVGPGDRVAKESSLISLMRRGIPAHEPGDHSAGTRNGMVRSMDLMNSSVR